MTSKMDLIMAGPAGHILAAGVRQDMSGPQPDPAALVGEGLLIRDAASGATLLSVSSAYLKVQSVDLRDDVLISDRQFILTEGLPEMGIAAAAAPVVLNGATITVNLPAAAPQGGSNVYVYIGGAPQPIVHQVRVAAAAVNAAEPLVLPNGDYCALVLAPGCVAAVVEISIP